MTENRNGSLTLDFADGTYVFRLAIGELEELQEKTAAGPFVLLRRLLGGEWQIDDVRQTIRLGLVGGGLDPVKALGLVRRYVEQRSDWLGNATLAQAILSAALVGAPEEEPGKSDAPETETEASNFLTDALSSAISTPQPEPQE